MMETLDELSFRREAESALESLKQLLIAAEDAGVFEVEENSGVLNLIFEEPPAKFVLTPNAPVRQIWISALSTSFKLEWSGSAFLLPKTGENLVVLTERLIREHSGEEVPLK